MIAVECPVPLGRCERVRSEQSNKSILNPTFLQRALASFLVALSVIGMVAVLVCSEAGEGTAGNAIPSVHRSALELPPLREFLLLLIVAALILMHVLSFLVAESLAVENNYRGPAKGNAKDSDPFSQVVLEDPQHFLRHEPSPGASESGVFEHDLAQGNGNIAAKWIAPTAPAGLSS